MGKAAGHKFGQILGELLELSVKPLLAGFAKQHGLYLDARGPRKARTGKKVTWVDVNGNKHDLDFVLELNGSDDRIGTPLLFIETAWRRYTKHSRNKSQEIQGAILPLIERYKDHAPAFGVILAGEYTSGSITQLRSTGFAVLHLPYKSVISVLAANGIDAEFNEKTKDSDFKKRTAAWQRHKNKAQVAAQLLERNHKEVGLFLEGMKAVVSRRVVQVLLLPLHGEERSFVSVKEALKGLRGYNPSSTRAPMAKCFIRVDYSNGSKVEAWCVDKPDAERFLLQF